MFYVTSMAVTEGLQICAHHLCIDFHQGKFYFTVLRVMYVHAYMLGGVGGDAGASTSSEAYRGLQPPQRRCNLLRGCRRLCNLHGSCTSPIEALQHLQRLWAKDGVWEKAAFFYICMKCQICQVIEFYRSSSPGRWPEVKNFIA